MKKRGRPSIKDRANPIPKTGDPCKVCLGTGTIEEEDGSTTTCEWCGGSGIDPGEDIALTFDQITAEDLSGVSAEVGYHPPAWGYVDPRALIAASVNVVGSRLLGRAEEGKGPKP
jgi:hypothetical protein